MVKNVSVVVLNRFRRTRTPHSLISGGFRFRVTALRTDGRTDRPSYRDARTHLKRERIKKKKEKKREKKKKKEKENSRKSVTWSAVPDAPMLVYFVIR